MGILLSIFLLFFGLIFGAASGTNNQANTSRSEDAATILGAASEFMANNSGQVPTDFVDGELTGQPGSNAVPVMLGHYETVKVSSGAQDPLNKDELWLVTGAECSAQNGASASSARSIVALYVHENDDGFEPKCSAV
jgi:hypothetical protein